MTRMDEDLLLRRIAKGDRAAFEEFYRRTSPWLAVRLCRRVADEHIVGDVPQETYLSVWRGASGFARVAEGSALGWLWTVTARRLVDVFRDGAGTTTRSARDRNGRCGQSSRRGDRAGGDALL